MSKPKKYGNYVCVRCNANTAEKYRGVCVYCKPKKKPVPYIALEAKASVALDGHTNSCLACAWNSQYQQHTCHLRPMSAAERAVVEAAAKWAAVHIGFCDCGLCRDLGKACRALRAERSRGQA